MQFTVTIPDAVVHAIQDGAGRAKLQQRFSLNQHLARFYLKVFAASHQQQITKTAFVLADLHIPYHRQAPLETALIYGVAHDPDEVILLGDGFDFYKVSFWKKDPSRMRFPDEVQVCKTLLKEISDTFPHAKKTYIAGNHDLRLMGYLWDKAPELYGLPELAVPRLLGLDELGWEYINTGELLDQECPPYRFGNLYLYHGNEDRVYASSVNVPRNYYNRGYCDIFVGHHHQTQEYRPRKLDHTYVQAYSIGCLCDLSPSFSRRNRWNHGFAWLSWDGQYCTVKNFRIRDGKYLE